MGASLSGVFNAQQFTDMGAPLVGGRLYTYSPSTTTLKIAYTEPTGTTPQTYTFDGAGGQYIGLDARGELPAPLFLAAGGYDLTLRRADGTLVWTRRAYGTDSGSDTLRADLADTSAAGKNSGIPGYSGALTYPATSLGGRLNDAGCSPRSLGATGDGVADDAAYIQQCLTYSRTLDLRNRSWKIGSTINLPAGCCVDMRGANIVAATGSNPLFKFDGAKEGLLILGGGGTVTGTASAFLQCAGSSNTPTTAGQYARQIRLESVYVTDPNIGLFLDFQLAVRQVFAEKCFAYTASGINANGKCVEIKVHKSIIYSSTGGTGTYGVKLASPGGTSYYNEGWHFTDCTIDNFEKTFDVSDVFVFTVTGGYNGCKSGGKVASFGQPTSSLCVDIKFTGTVIAGATPVEFVPTSGRDYGAIFSGVTFLSAATYGVSIGNNAAGISVLGCKFRNASAGSIAVRGANNNARIVVQNIDVDATYTGGAVFLQGANGADCAVGSIAYAGAGEQIYAERPVFVKGLKVATAIGAVIRRNVQSAAIAGSYATAANIVSLTGRFAKGETGMILATLNCAGMDAANQRFDISVPTGVVIPSGTGWDMKYVYPNATQARVVISVPYHVTDDVEATANNVKITNAAGNTVTVAAHSWACVEHNN